MNDARQKQINREKSARYRARHPDRVRDYKIRNADAIKEGYVQYRTNNLEREKSRAKAIYQARRLLTFEFFGCFCAKCGFDDRRALQVDHIEGGGRKERKGKEKNRVPSWLL